MKKIFTLAAVLVLVVFSSCVKQNFDEEVEDNFYVWGEDHEVLNKTLNLPQVPHNYAKEFRQHGVVSSDQVNNYVATLGRVLFYDKKLSANNTIACVGCHKQEKAFSDDVAFSMGFNGELTSRNSLPLASVLDFETSYGGNSTNAFIRQNFFWDDRANSIVEQSRQTLQNNVEMGADMTALGQELLQEDYYQLLFERAFPNNTTMSTEDKILVALQSFVNAIFSNDSKFDKGLSAVDNNPDTDFPTFFSNENKGKKLFNQHCGNCHGNTMQSATLNVANNGLDEVYSDRGVGAITHNPEDNGKFKVPMLRNIELTAPYMHDGRFATLEEVVEHYNSGVKSTANLHQNLKSSGGEPKKLDLTQQDKADLVAFLKTLTDTQGLMHERFSDPFKH